MAGSNNYLGLTAHPRVREAAIQAIHQYGTGCSGSRYLTGTIDLNTTPTTSYTDTEILIRNSTTGEVEKTDSTSPAIYNFGMTYVMTNFNYFS